MVSAQVVGNDATVGFAGAGGNFELNVMLPVVAVDLLESASLLADAARNFARRAVVGMRATDKGPELVERGLMLVTALAPKVGYEKAASIAKQAHQTGRTVRELTREQTDLSAVEIEYLLDPERMVGS